MKSFKTAVAVVLALLMVTAGMAVAGTVSYTHLTLPTTPYV